MTSFHFELEHPKDEAAAAFVAEVGRMLQKAVVDRKALGKITQQEAANRLGVSRSRINKCLSGYANLSLESIAELCWAFDIEPRVAFHQILNDRTINDNHSAHNTENKVELRRSEIGNIQPVITPSSFRNSSTNAPVNISVNKVSISYGS